MAAECLQRLHRVADDAVFVLKGFAYILAVINFKRTLSNNIAAYDQIVVVNGSCVAVFQFVLARTAS